MEKKIVFRTQFDTPILEGQKFEKKSLTVPDMSLTIKDILTKALGGSLPALSRNVAYGGNAIVHSIPVDITEIETSARNIKRRVDAKKAEEEAKVHEENVRKAALEEAQRKEFEDWKKTQSQPQS